MNGERLFELLGGLDPTLLADGMTPPPKKPHRVLEGIAIAASVILIFASALILPNRRPSEDTPTETETGTETDRRMIDTEAPVDTEPSETGTGTETGEWGTETGEPEETEPPETEAHTVEVPQIVLTEDVGIIMTGLPEKELIYDGDTLYENPSDFRYHLYHAIVKRSETESAFRYYVLDCEKGRFLETFHEIRHGSTVKKWDGESCVLKDASGERWRFFMDGEEFCKEPVKEETDEELHPERHHRCVSPNGKTEAYVVTNEDGVTCTVYLRRNGKDEMILRPKMLGEEDDELFESFLPAVFLDDGRLLCHTVAYSDFVYGFAVYDVSIGTVTEYFSYGTLDSLDRTRGVILTKKTASGDDDMEPDPYRTTWYELSMKDLTLLAVYRSEEDNIIRRGDFWVRDEKHTYQSNEAEERSYDILSADRKTVLCSVNFRFGTSSHLYIRDNRIVWVNGEDENQTVLYGGFDFFYPENLAFVRQYARKVGAFLEESNEGLSIPWIRITEMTPLNTGSVGPDDGVEVYRLGLRFGIGDPDGTKPGSGITVENGEITSWNDEGAPCLFVYNRAEDDQSISRTFLAVLSSRTVEEKYGTEEMLAEYGSAYTAAAMELWTEHVKETGRK